ncbi:hypothetical protein AEQU3_02261 [Aequorivita antarctica]|nr:hypothetical protein AEQU3_02261 [Aequorivita antarctica]
MKKFLLLVWFTLVCFSFLGYGKLGKIFYTSESAEYLTDVSNINFIYCSAGLIGFILVILFAKRKLLKYTLLLSFFSIWLLSTRKIAISSFYDGRLGIGWNCFLTEEFFLCYEKSDCETTLAYNTTIEKLALWQIKIKNKELSKTIFIGPLVWAEVIDVLEKNIGNGTYTK